MWLYHRVMSPNDADGMASSVDSDQTARSGSALFAQAYLSENLGLLRYPGSVTVIDLNLHRADDQIQHAHTV